MIRAGSEHGFTLVELAVAMIVIGILIGGAVKGAAIIESAREKRLVQAIKGIEAAVLTFREHYNAMPGDMPAATVRLPGCHDANFCENGDGNGFVASGAADQYGWLDKLTGGGMERESIQFWKHLALVEMISGVELDGFPDDPAWVSTHPRSPFGGGFEFYYDGFVGAGGRPGHILRLSDTGLSTESLRGVLTPRQAARIDRVIDDGNPGGGFVLADYGTTSNECRGDAGGRPFYRESDAGAACVLYVAISR